jgi:hypothetical protein
MGQQEDEVAVLSESICDDLDSIGFSPNPNSGECGEQNLADLMTNRELVGVILSDGGSLQGLRDGDCVADHSAGRFRRAPKR